jgi:flagellar motor switch protein FliN/FliY
MSAQDEISHFSDVPIDIEVELDRRKMTVREILQLDQGSVVKMSRSAGENIDLLVSGRVIGSGEIVIIEDSIGVRITDFNEEEQIDDPGGV